MYRKSLKYLLDLVIAIIAGIILIPLFLIISLAIKIDSTGPVFFKQRRLGRYGLVFSIYKFRSMVTDQAQLVKIRAVVEDDPRITRVGRFIRKTSIDELPQIINIIKGEMSFIGPRPPVPDYPKKYSEYNEFEKQRFTVKPGISGLAQIRCREIHDWGINIPIDVEYVSNYSFIYDLRLFAASLFIFFRTKNIYTK